eukprot:TRINITY_DN6157_c0_g2_i1.p1 TRINITY_DN6157_c0_g2~~TRINITY_DN6157_c0_g2_i1.p1  ORF type:complete len:271 (-),score=74.71 TRINITY_DN6157_c0_g2_i1:20-778(-)
MSEGRRSKRHRIRAHVNPLSVGDFVYPRTPEEVDWHRHYPDFYPEPSQQNQEVEVKRPEVKIADVGCGFGGLLVSLSPLFPEKLILGMEIRVKVVDFVQKRIAKLRVETPPAADAAIRPYSNISVERTNAMKYLPNYFRKGQLEKIFFCFPDPHFKKSNHRRRIISHNLLSEYAYALCIGGIIYTISDVLDLHQWMASHLEQHPLFQRLTEEELANDPAVEAMTNGTEEGQKVTKAGGSKYLAVFRRIAAVE